MDKRTRKKRYPYEPDYAVPPGNTLQDTIDALGMSQREFAARTDLTTKTVNQIIKGEAPITQSNAIRFERVTGVSAAMWNNLQSLYAEQKEKLKEQERLRTTRRRRKMERRNFLKTLVFVPLFGKMGKGKKPREKKEWKYPNCVSMYHSNWTICQPGEQIEWARFGNFGTVYHERQKWSETWCGSCQSASVCEKLRDYEKLNGS